MIHALFIPKQICWKSFLRIDNLWILSNNTLVLVDDVLIISVVT